MPPSIYFSPDDLLFIHVVDGVATIIPASDVLEHFMTHHNSLLESTVTELVEATLKSHHGIPN